MTASQRHEVPGWYLRDLGDGNGRHLWFIAEDHATRADVTNPQGGAGTYFSTLPGETIWQALRRQTNWLDGVDDPGPFHQMVLGPGEYYRRIARPLAYVEHGSLWSPDLSGERCYVNGAQNQLASLMFDLRNICRVVQPTPATLSVFGHEIRNLLILAATEVEMHWRGILAAHGQVGGGTKKYVRLAEPLRLREFTVSFHPCPDIDPIAPFANWHAEEPTKSLRWYAAYNGVKHNRELEFEQATLGHAFAALAACAVMLVAQFGDEVLTPELSSFVSIDGPAWPFEEMYLPPHDAGPWKQTVCPNLD